MSRTDSAEERQDISPLRSAFSTQSGGHEPTQTTQTKSTILYGTMKDNIGSVGGSGEDLDFKTKLSMFEKFHGSTGSMGSGSIGGMGGSASNMNVSQRRTNESEDNNNYPVYKNASESVLNSGKNADYNNGDDDFEDEPDHKEPDRDYGYAPNPVHPTTRPSTAADTETQKTSLPPQRKPSSSNQIVYKKIDEQRSVKVIHEKTAESPMFAPAEYAHIFSGLDSIGNTSATTSPVNSSPPHTTKTKDLASRQRDIDPKSKEGDRRDYMFLELESSLNMKFDQVFGKTTGSNSSLVNNSGGGPPIAPKPSNQKAKSTACDEEKSRPAQPPSKPAENGLKKDYSSYYGDLMAIKMESQMTLNEHSAAAVPRPAETQQPKHQRRPTDLSQQDDQRSIDLSLDEIDKILNDASAGLNNSMKRSMQKEPSMKYKDQLQIDIPAPAASPNSAYSNGNKMTKNSTMNSLKESSSVSQHGSFASLNLLLGKSGDKKTKNASSPESGVSIPTAEQDAEFLASLPANETHEIVLVAVSDYRYLPGATHDRPYIRIPIKHPVKVGRANTQRHSNFLTIDTSQVVSRSHLEIWHVSNPPYDVQPPSPEIMSPDLEDIQSKHDSSFYIRDIGSNSGTWVNGQRMSESGAFSDEFPLQSGDLVRIGADIKRELRSGESIERLKCIILRVFCREGPVFDAEPEVPVNTKLKTLTARRPASKIIAPGLASGVSNAPTLPYEQATSAQADAKQTEHTYGQIQPSKQCAKYFMLYNGTTFPQKIKKVSIHCPANAIDTQGSQHNQATHSNGSLNSDAKNSTARTHELIGPEVVQISLQHWGATPETKDRLTMSDLRIPLGQRWSQQTIIGTSVELVKDDALSHRDAATNEHLPGYKVVLITGRTGADSKRLVIQLATIEVNSAFKYTLKFCFQPLREHYAATEVELLPPGPLLYESTVLPCGYRQPVFEQQPNPNKIPPIYKLVGKLPSYSSDKYPSVSFVGDFKSLMGKKDETSISNLMADITSTHTNSSADNIAAVSNSNLTLNMTGNSGNEIMAILKCPAPSRSQSPIAQIQPRATLKKSIRETKYVHPILLDEQTLFSSFAAVEDGWEYQEYCERFGVQNERELPIDVFVYKKEWLSLCVMAATIFGLLKDI